MKGALEGIDLRLADDFIAGAIGDDDVLAALAKHVRPAQKQLLHRAGRRVVALLQHIAMRRMDIRDHHRRGRNRIAVDDDGIDRANRPVAQQKLVAPRAVVSLGHVGRQHEGTVDVVIYAPADLRDQRGEQRVVIVRRDAEPVLHGAKRDEIAGSHGWMLRCLSACGGRSLLPLVGEGTRPAFVSHSRCWKSPRATAENNAATLRPHRRHTHSGACAAAIRSGSNRGAF